MYLCKEQDPKHNFKLEGSPAYEEGLVSVIIPVYTKKAASLPECLENVYSQDYEKMEVIIVNNGIDKEELESILSSFRHKESLRVVHVEKNMGASYGRNKGAAHSKAEFLWFVDSDVYKVDSKVVSFSVQTLKERHDVGAIGAQCARVNDDIYLFLGRRCDTGFKENKEKYKLFEDEYINTCNLLMRRRDFSRVNGFTDFIEYMQDDLDFGFKIRKSGLKCVVDYRAAAYHPFSSKSWDSSQLWMFYKNSLLFYFINYSLSELLEFAAKKYLAKAKANGGGKSSEGKPRGASLMISRLNNLKIFFSASLFLAGRIFSVIKQRKRRQELLSKLEEEGKRRDVE